MAIDNVTLSSSMQSVLLGLKNSTDVIDRTTSRMASGIKVQSPGDDPLVFFRANEHLFRASSLNVRKDEVGEVIQTIKAAKNGSEAILSLVNQAKSIAQSARKTESRLEKDLLRVQYNAILYQIDTLMKDSGYRGVNLLAGTSHMLKAYFDENGASQITIRGFDSSSSGLGLTQIYQNADDIRVVKTGNDFSITGNFARKDDAQLFSFSIDSDQIVELGTLSNSGGTNAAGETISSGGFNPILALYDSNGNLIDVDDDGGSGLDALIQRALTAGDYTVALTVYDTLPAGYPGPSSLSDGFSGSDSSDLPTSATSLAVDFSNISSVTADEFKQALENISNAKSILRAEMERFANNMNIISTRQDFTRNMTHTLQEGADDLTLADLDEEGATLLMLQARQALGMLAMEFSSMEGHGALQVLSDENSSGLTKSQLEKEEAIKGDGLVKSRNSDKIGIQPSWNLLI